MLDALSSKNTCNTIVGTKIDTQIDSYLNTINIIVVDANG